MYLLGSLADCLCRGTCEGGKADTSLAFNGSIKSFVFPAFPARDLFCANGFVVAVSRL